MVSATQPMMHTMYRGGLAISRRAWRDRAAINHIYMTPLRLALHGPRRRRTLASGNAALHVRGLLREALGMHA
jgi:hypothetical protein